MSARMVVRDILAKYGFTNRFTIRTVNFTDLARNSPKFVSIKEWKPDPVVVTIQQEIETTLGRGYVVEWCLGG